MNKPSNKLDKYLLKIIRIQVKVNELIIKTYNGFLNTPLRPAVNPISYPQFIIILLEVIQSNLL